MPFIYCIFNKDNNKIYIGSTSQEYLSMRLAQHRYYYRKNKEKPDSVNGRYSSEKVFEDDSGEHKCFIQEIITCESFERTEVESFYIKYFRELGFNVVNENDSKFDKEKYKRKRLEDYRNRPEYYKAKSLKYYYNNREMVLAKAKIKSLKNALNHFM